MLSEDSKALGGGRSQQFGHNQNHIPYLQCQQMTDTASCCSTEYLSKKVDLRLQII